MRFHRHHGIFLAALILLVPGCVTMQPWAAKHEPAANICQVHSFWDSRVLETQDVVNGGRPLRGLAGRVYLFSSDQGVPEKGDGSVAVELCDISNTQPGAQPKVLERWNFDPTNLSKLYRKDKIGWGYTLFLPWSTQTPEITRVQLSVSYVPAKGTPVYSEPTTLSVKNQLTVPLTHQLIGPNGQPIAKQ